jgi:AraC-like DNA-binding protein
MTAPAKELTKSAKVRKNAANAVHTDLASTARVFLGALVRLGYSQQALLTAAGVDLPNLDDPDARVSCQVIGGMCGYAMQTRPLKNLGMKLAAQTPMGAFPLLDYLIVTCETVADGLKQLARYLRLNGAPYMVEIRDDEDPIRIVFHGTRANCPLEFGVCLTVLRLREESENRLTATYVTFTHQPEDILEMERVLGCSVQGQTACDSFALSREAWQLPMRRRDPILRSVLERHAEEIIARLPTSGSVTLEIRQALMSRITQGDTEIQSLARALATSSRSLQRRLASSGTSYKKLLDSTRSQAATRYLQNRTLSIGEVAYLLGYSEPAAFHRAFKRWNGITPQEFRRRKS